MNFVRGATHAEFIKSQADGQFYFLEVAARVGGAYIAETLEAATGVNIWREWANIELARDVAPYQHPTEQGGLRRRGPRAGTQEWPDTSEFTDPEIVHRS